MLVHTLWVSEDPDPMFHCVMSDFNSRMTLRLEPAQRVSYAELLWKVTWHREHREQHTLFQQLSAFQKLLHRFVWLKNIIKYTDVCWRRRFSIIPFIHTLFCFLFCVSFRSFWVWCETILSYYWLKLSKEC